MGSRRGLRGSEIGLKVSKWVWGVREVLKWGWEAPEWGLGA